MVQYQERPHTRRGLTSGSLVCLLAIAVLWPATTERPPQYLVLSGVLLATGVMLCLTSLAPPATWLRRIVVISGGAAGFGIATLATYLTVGPVVLIAMMLVAVAMGLYSLVAPSGASPIR